jgi:hypothetical protein
VFLFRKEVDLAPIEKEMAVTTADHEVDDYVEEMV